METKPHLSHSTSTCYGNFFWNENFAYSIACLYFHIHTSHELPVRLILDYFQSTRTMAFTSDKFHWFKSLNEILKKVYVCIIEIVLERGNKLEKMPLNCSDLRSHPRTILTSIHYFVFICYSTCFFVAFVGNGTMFLILIR